MTKLLMEDKVKKPEVMHSFNVTNTSKIHKKLFILLFVVTVIGVGTGYGLSQYSASTGSSIPVLRSGSGAQKGKTFGSDDTKTFKDTAQGDLAKGGVEGEGQYHLVRPGGDSQNVYMTSSTVDLAQFVGKKIKVWGQTQTAQTAGWLMDVGRVEVL